MIPARYPYSGILDRPKVVWPDGKRLAVWIVPNVEHYEYIPPPNAVRDPWPRTPHPDVFGYSHRDYGNRVGIWRLFEVVDELKARCSVSLNLGVFEHFPEIMEACEARDWDIICHGIYNTKHILKLSPEEEGAYIHACIAKSRQLIGRSFNGWFSPGLSYTHNTIDLIGEAGINYFCEWTFDEHPVEVRSKSGRVFAMPYQFDINDGVFFNRRYRHADGEVFAKMMIDHFDRMYAESELQGRVMCIALHPYLIGQPHNIGPLRRALSYILGHDGVWNATGSEILDWWMRHYADPLTSLEAEHAKRPSASITLPSPPPNPRAEPEFVRFSVLDRRPPLTWPDAKPVALSVCLHFDHWELDGDGLYDPRFNDMVGGHRPDYLTQSWVEYGNRVGIFRILEALSRFPFKVTVAANGAACTNYPALVQRFLSPNYEFAGHGSDVNRMISSRMSEAEEESYIRTSLDAVEAACGRRPTGWFGSSFGESARTPALLAKQGVRYIVDWSNDEQPYSFDVDGAPLSVPACAELDDLELLYHRKILPDMYPAIMEQAFEKLVADGARSGRFLPLHIHPWVFGKPHTIRYLEQVLERLAKSDQVWHATVGEVQTFLADPGRRTG